MHLYFVDNIYAWIYLREWIVINFILFEYYLYFHKYWFWYFIQIKYTNCKKYISICYRMRCSHLKSIDFKIRIERNKQWEPVSWYLISFIIKINPKINTGGKCREAGVEGLPLGGVLSPILWYMVVDQTT